MSSLLRLSAVVAALAIDQVLGNPTAKSGSFKVDQVSRPRTQPLRPIEEFLKPFLKYNEGLSSDQERMLEQYGSVVADLNVASSEYLSPVQIGRQTLYLQFDTGSSDLWVFSNYTQTNETMGQTLYKPGPSARLLHNYTWDISYGSGSSSSGIVFRDTVSVGGVTTHHQAVEAAEQVSSQFTSDVASDGLLGLAGKVLNSVEPVQQNTFFETVKSSLKEPLFAADLKLNAPGAFDFGWIDHQRYTGDITWSDSLGSSGFWNITVGNSSVGDMPVSNGSEVGPAIVDTGTSLLYLPLDSVLAYKESVPGAQFTEAGTLLFPCNATTLPELHIEIETTTFSIPGKALNYSTFTNGNCVSGLQPSAFLPFNILGDVFLQNFYVIFKSEHEQKSVGVANKHLTS